MNTNNQNAQQFLEAIKELSKQYEISSAKIGEIITSALAKVYNKSKEECILHVNVDVDNGIIDAYEELKVIDNLPDGEYDDFFEITIDEAKQYGNYQIGDICKKPFDILSSKNFGPVQVRQIMQIFRQRLNEVNNTKIHDAWINKQGELITAPIEKYDEKVGYYLVELDEGKNFGFLSKKECIPGEVLTPGEKYRYYVKEIKQQSRGWPIILSRADVGFVKKIISLEIPEIATGEIIIQKIERIAGFKTKIAVSSSNALYDPVGICVGPKGSRIKYLSEQIAGEKIEIISFIEDKREFLITALGAKNIEGIKFIPAGNESDLPHATIIVNDDKLAVVIGKKGYNIKLISKMVGCSIDVLTPDQAKNSQIEYEKIDLTKYNVAKLSRFVTNHHANLQSNHKTGKLDIHKYLSNDELLSQLDSSSSNNADIYKDLNMEKTYHANHVKAPSDDINDFDYENADLGDLEEEFAFEINDVLNGKK